MKKVTTSLLALLGLASVCGHLDSYEVDSFTTKSGKAVKFHALVHSSIRIEYDGKEIEIDPVTKLGRRPSITLQCPKRITSSSPMSISTILTR